jgi:hypothetical protein
MSIEIPTRDEVRRWSQALSVLGAVMFVWDDGWASVMDAAAINEARGQQATVAVTTRLVGAPGKLTAAQVRELEARGHEIAAHGAQHTNGLPALAVAQRAAEYVECLDWFAANGVTRPSTWVYTFGGPTGRNDDTDRELWLRVDRVLDTSGTSPLAAATRRDQFGFVLKRLQAESDSGRAFDLAQTLIRLAAQQPVVVGFYMHQLGGGANSLTADEYAQLCDLCVDLGVPAVTARDALPPSHMLVDGGFEEPNTVGLWLPQVTGASTVTAETDTPAVGLPGTRSLRLHVVDTGAFEFAQVFQYVPVVAGRTYTLSGRYRTSSGAGTAARVRFGSYDHKGGSVGTATTASLPEATSWTRFSVDFTAAPDAVNAQVALLDDPASNVTADVWFDHVCLLPRAVGAFG